MDFFLKKSVEALADNISILGVIAMNMEKVKQEGITFYFMVMVYQKKRKSSKGNFPKLAREKYINIIK